VADQGTVSQAAEAARTGQQMTSMKAAEIDDGANKILDVNSMMTALDDYLKKASDGSSGVPINYNLKDITKGTLCEMWVAKYCPNKYVSITYEDSAAPAAPAGAAAGSSGTPAAGGSA
jgi:hypothetical protein